MDTMDHALELIGLVQSHAIGHDGARDTVGVVAQDAGLHRIAAAAVEGVGQRVGA